MPTAVVCDDDPVLRGSITSICDDLGLQVVAETDTAGDAVMLVRRFEVDVLILDTSLSSGSGELALQLLKDEGLHPQTIVFTLYADDAPRLLSLGAREVVAKPDLGALRTALVRLLSAVEETSTFDADRRVASRPTEEAPSIWRSPSGVSPAQDLTHSILALEQGDSVLAVQLLGLDTFETDVGPLLADDCLLAVARILRGQLRVQDLLHLAKEGDVFVALLRGGDNRSADAVWTRLVGPDPHGRPPGEPHGAGSPRRRPRWHRRRRPRRRGRASASAWVGRPS